MSGAPVQTVQREITIINRLGLHARAAARFVDVASGFRSEIQLIRGERRVNGKSIMGVMMLAAAKGTQLLVEAHGSDARAAIEALVELVEAKFGEGE